RPRWLSQRLFPDRFRFWARRAMRCAARDLADQPFDIVWTTFPPASAVLVGLDAAQRLDRPLVLDLRDPWIGPGGYSPDRPRRLHAHQALERRAVRAAAAVTAVSEAMWHDVAERCGVPRERGIVIPNGFDPARCPPLDLSPLPADRPTLAHVGSVTVRNCPNRFLTSLAAIPEPRRACRLRFVGNLSPGYVARLGLAQTVETTGMLSPDAAWRATLAADALLLLVGEYVGRWGHNTKLFEYLRAARPILCVEESPGSNDAALLRQIAPQRSVFARFDDPASIERGLADVASLARAAPRRTLDDSPALRAYDRAALAARLTDRLDRLAPPRGPAAAG
ncbi:MAG: glycosyltransferase, partial [Anaerolineae bacterium]